jgi:hypothetical protein
MLIAVLIVIEAYAVAAREPDPASIQLDPSPGGAASIAP